MDHFTYINATLYAENVAIPDIAKEVGTPFYCYSHATLTRHYEVFAEGLAAVNPLICFATKANSNLAVLATLAKAGSGADVVSEGEIRLALKAGISPHKIVFSGVGKQRSEMKYALEQGIFQFNVESDAELHALSETALAMNKRAPIALRVNPDVAPETHAKISTGNKETKFGVAYADAMAMYRLAASLDGIDVRGISVHIGSQLTSLAPFEAAFIKVRDLAEALRAEGIAISVLDLGGGLGIPYEGDQSPPTPAEYGAMVARVMEGVECQLVFEPGRLIAGNAGILVSEVIYMKDTGTRHFAIIDAGMNDLIRPTLYDAHHDIVPITQSSAATAAIDVVGPVCETGDIFGSMRDMPVPKAGDLLAIRSCGAYGAVMMNSYNARPCIPEVMVKDDAFEVIRTRETYDLLLNRDSIPSWI